MCGGHGGSVGRGDLWVKLVDWGYKSKWSRCVLLIYLFVWRDKCEVGRRGCKRTQIYIVFRGMCVLTDVSYFPHLS